MKVIVCNYCGNTDGRTMQVTSRFPEFELPGTLDVCSWSCLSSYAYDRDKGYGRTDTYNEFAEQCRDNL